METITIEYQSNIKEKLIAFLNSFSKNELMIVEEKFQNDKDETFISYRDKLHSEVEKIASGESRLMDFDELDMLLEQTIFKHESLVF